MEPTGNLIISQENGKVITVSKNFYFEKQLYTTSIDLFMNMGYVRYTDWFKSYLNEFIKKLKWELMDSFKKYPNFNIQFKKDTQFILELR